MCCAVIFIHFEIWEIIIQNSSVIATKQLIIKNAFKMKKATCRLRSVNVYRLAGIGRKYFSLAQK